MNNRRNFLLNSAAAIATSSLDRQITSAESVQESELVFLARVPYGVPSGRHIHFLDDTSWLSFFQRIWGKRLTCKKALGVSSYGIDPLFEAMKGRRAPKTNEELIKFIEQNCYNWNIKSEDGLIEYISDDDELDMSYHFLNSAFVKKNRKRLAFPLHKGWLPRNVNPSKTSQPRTWVVSHMPSQSADSNLWDIFEVKGSRLDQIGEIHSVMKNSDATFDSEQLEDFLEHQPKDQRWNVTMVKFLNKNASFKGNLSEFQCSPHICEIYHHCENWGETRVFQQVIVFDDLWASTHTELFGSFKTLRKNHLLPSK